MRILYYVPDLGVCNGVASYSMNYYSVLKDKVEIDFLLTNDVNTPYYDKIKSFGNNVYFMPNTKNIIKIHSFLDNLFKNGKYDIVHCNVINRGAIVLKKAKKHGIAVRILHSHTTRNGDTIIKRIIRWPFKLKALKYANTYFACSKLAGDYLFKNKKYLIINNAVTFNDNNTSDFKHDTFTLGTIGRFTLQKNPYFILSILKALKNLNFNFKFIWVGSGELFNDIILKSKELDVFENISFVGNTLNVYEYYKQMDLFILPSLYEGLPVVGIEAQVLGIPCLFSSTITKEILINNNTRMLDINDAKLWAEEIFKLSKKTDKLLFTNSAKKKYDLNYNAKLLLDTYRDLLK